MTRYVTAATAQMGLTLIFCNPSKSHGVKDGTFIFGFKTTVTFHPQDIVPNIYFTIDDTKYAITLHKDFCSEHGLHTKCLKLLKTCPSTKHLYICSCLDTTTGFHTAGEKRAREAEHITKAQNRARHSQDVDPFA